MTLDHFILHKGTDYHCAFPDLIRLDNGDLVTVFREAPAHPADKSHPQKRNDKLTHHHIDPGSRIALMRSTNDGVAWAADSRVVIDASNGTQDLNMPLITQLSFGELVVVNHRWFTNMAEAQITAIESNRFIRPHQQDDPFGVVGFDSLYFIRSSDRGYTWGEPREVSISSVDYVAAIGKNAIIEMPDGLWLLPVYGQAIANEPSACRVVRSWDGGQTWGQPSTIAYDPGQRIGFHEPPLLRLSNGKLLTVIRTSNADGYLYQAFSTDNGWIWQGLKRTPIWGFPCHLLRLRSGSILCTYGYRREPFGVRAVVSKDEGETWDIDHEMVIRDDGLHTDLGYPASIQLQDDRILSVYYFHGTDGLRYIGGSIYTADDS